jgi:hypothetical protein
MANYTLEILTTNYSGQTADIIFSPCTGGTINLGSQVLPYNYVSEYIYGDYELTFSAYGGSQCFLSIPCPSPTPTPTQTITPTPTNTATPTVTPTNTPTPSSAPEGFTVTVSQVSSDVVWSGSGSFNLTDLTVNQTLPGVSSGYNAPNAQFIVGSSSNATTYSGSSFTTFPTSFGVPGGATVSSTSGSVFGIVQTEGPSGPREVLVPQGYTSGTVISGSATYNGQTIAGMGLISGTYVWSWGSGANTSSITLIIE